MITVKAQADLDIIQVYFPTSSSTKEELDDMYERLKELMRLTNNKPASVGSQTSEQGCIGTFGLGSINQRGEKLIEFCEQFQFIITNTMFSVLKRRRYTWKAPGDTARHQIDYILVKRKHRKNIRSSHSYPGSQIDSDHVLVKVKCNIRFKKHVLRKKKNWCLEKLKDEKKVTDFQRDLGDRMREKGILGRYQIEY